MWSFSKSTWWIFGAAVTASRLSGHFQITRCVCAQAPAMNVAPRAEENPRIRASLRSFNFSSSEKSGTPSEPGPPNAPQYTTYFLSAMMLIPSFYFASFRCARCHIRRLYRMMDAAVGNDVATADSSLLKWRG